jgi:hypothetical protein
MSSAPSGGAKTSRWRTSRDEAERGEVGLYPDERYEVPLCLLRPSMKNPVTPATIMASGMSRFDENPEGIAPQSAERSAIAFSFDADPESVADGCSGGA